MLFNSVEWVDNFTFWIFKLPYSCTYHLVLQAFLDFHSFDFRGFRFKVVYNSILFSSPLVLLSNLHSLSKVFFMCPHINSVNRGMHVVQKTASICWKLFFRFYWNSNKSNSQNLHLVVLLVTSKSFLGFWVTWQKTLSVQSFVSNLTLILTHSAD